MPDLTTVLVFEDDESWRELLARFLRQSGFSVVMASNYDEAMRQLSAKQIALATVDIRMVDADSQDMTGLKLIKTLAEKGIPSIVLTGYPSIDVVRRAFDYNILAFLTKMDFDQQQFKQLIKDSVSEILKEGQPWIATIQQQRTASLKLFISSTMDDLQAEREAVKRAIEELYLSPVFAEGLGSRTGTPREEILRELKDSDIYIGILGQRYGYITDKQVSATEEEYQEALANQKPILIYIKDAEKRDVLLTRWIKELESYGAGHLRSTFKTVEELKERVKHDVMREVSRMARKQ